MTSARRIASVLAALLAGVLAFGSVIASAEVNRAVGGIGGINNGTLIGGDGSGDAQITIDIVDLGLVKQARGLDGTVMPDGSDVSAGEQIYFVIYVDNPTRAAVDDVQLFDPLNESQFTYIQNSMEIAVVPTGSDDSQIWAAPWAPQTDGVGPPDDMGSAKDTGGPAGLDQVTVGAFTGQINELASIPAQSMLVVRFMVRVN